MSAPSPTITRDLTRTTLAVVFLGALILATLWIMRPFLTSFAWATMIVLSTWPLLLRLQARFGGRRGLATTAITSVLLLILIIPLATSVGALVSNMDRIVAWVQSPDKLVVPPPPEWVAGIPLVGPKLSGAWERTASGGPGSLAAQIEPYAGKLLNWFVSQIGGIGAMILQFLLTVIMCAILYTNGETAARGVRLFAYRLAGASGERAAVLAASSVRGVAKGVVLTAIIQTVLAGAGLLIASVPGAVLLTAAVFILCLAQIGPILIVLPAVIWKFTTGDTLFAVILLVFALIACTIDNVIRPFLIRKGADLPLLLIFAGVIGGLVALGIMGIFIGPVVLAVAYTLTREWVENKAEAVNTEPRASASGY